MALNRLIETHIAALCKLGWIWGGFEKGGDSPWEITVKERLLKGSGRGTYWDETSGQRFSWGDEKEESIDGDGDGDGDGNGAIYDDKEFLELTLIHPIQWFLPST